MAVIIKCYSASLKSEFPRTERDSATGLSNSFITWLMCFIPAGSQVLFVYWAPGFIQLFICGAFVVNILGCQRNNQESFLFNLNTILVKKKNFSGKMGWMIKKNPNQQNNYRGCIALPIIYKKIWKKYSFTSFLWRHFSGLAVHLILPWSTSAVSNMEYNLLVCPLVSK